MASTKGEKSISYEKHGKIKMKIWRDRDGKWITAKEFGQRWKKGVEGITPLAQVRSQLTFTWITLSGILCGIIVSAWNLTSLWWLGIILIAAFGNTIVGFIGIYQKYKQLLRIQKAIMEEHKQINDGF